MSATVFFLLVAAAWIAIGAITSIMMGRRGHRLFTWAILGAVFGPLVLVLAVDAVNGERRAYPRRIAEGVPKAGPVDVLVGIDGSPQATEALRAVVQLFGPRIGRLTVATVVDYDRGLASEAWKPEAAAASAIAEARSLTNLEAEVMVLSGRPDEALNKFALEDGFDVIAIGRKGKGATVALLGSVAERLAADASVPVLIAGR